MSIIVAYQKYLSAFISSRIVRTERGAAMVEYALLVALIAVVAIVAITTLGGNVKTKFNCVANQLASPPVSCP